MIAPARPSSTHCGTCLIPWEQHLVWAGKETRLWSVSHPLHTPGTPICQVRNGHLANIKRMLERWMSRGIGGVFQYHRVWLAVCEEMGRRGWEHPDALCRIDIPIRIGNVAEPEPREVLCRIA